jgi:hypothetical protein
VEFADGKLRYYFCADDKIRFNFSFEGADRKMPSTYCFEDLKDGQREKLELSNGTKTYYMEDKNKTTTVNIRGNKIQKYHNTVAEKTSDSKFLFKCKLLEYAEGKPSRYKEFDRKTYFEKDDVITKEICLKNNKWVHINQ